jgi:hypothetical protein
MASLSYEVWHAALVAECRRRIGLEWQIEFTQWKDRDWYESGDSPTDLIDHLIAKYDLQDLDTLPMGSLLRNDRPK